MVGRREFAEIMVTLGEVCERDPSEFKIEIYYSLLKNFPIGVLKAAVQKVLQKRKTSSFVKPGEILAAIEGNDDNKAILAWDKLINTVKREGPYSSVQFDDPVIHSVVELLGGWIDLCTMENEDLKWKLKEFEKLYGSLSLKSDHPKHLPGLVELDCIARGYEVPQPKLIGGRDVKRLE